MTLFAVFLYGYVLSQFYRAFLAVIAPELAAELHLDAATLADISAIFFVVFALAQFPLGLALDRIGPRRTGPVMMLAAAAGAALLARAHSGLDCIVANGLIGLGCSPIYMSALYVFARTLPADRFGYLCASLIGLGSLGNLLAATPLSLLVHAVGWRNAFDIIAALTLSAALLYALFVRDPPRATRPTPAATSSGPADARSSSRASILSELVQILSVPALWMLFPLMALGYSCVVAERGLWVGPYFAEVHGLDPVVRGNAVLVMAAAMSAGALTFGWLDRVPGRRTALVATGAVVAALGLGLLALQPQPPLWLAVATLAVIGAAGMHLPLVTAQSRAYFPDHLVGRGITFGNFLTIGGSGLLQWLSGILVGHLQAAGSPPARVYAELHLAFAVTIAAAAAIYILGRRRPGPG